MPKFAARQICDWLYAKHVDSIDSMTNLSLKARTRLKEIASLEKSYPVDCQVSSDGTKKYLFQVANEEGNELPNAFKYIEAVFIPDKKRGTLCISCQVGCRMGCRFCVTGKQGFHGNLTAAQILNQIFSIPEFDCLTNVVYMGMGEPMDNLDAVLQSIDILTSEWGLGWSPHRITVSSVGITPGIKRFLDSCDCHLAVSLHNPIAEERLQIMPMQKTYPIADTVALLKQYDWSGQRRISFEYTMFRNLNDTELHAREIIRLLAGLPCRMNFIRFHTSPDMPYTPSMQTTMLRFQRQVARSGIICTQRASRGEDIMAACGLLAGKQKGTSKR